MTAKVLTIVGARPQFVKAAAVSRVLGSWPGINEIMVHTGQHFDDSMSDIFFRELEIPPPAYSLGISGGGHGRMTGRMLEAIEAVMVAERPDAVLVYGDTNSTLAGALAAAKLLVPLVHVEAGLRSFNRTMPEEVNRVLVDHCSTLLLCPTALSVANLAREGVTDGVFHVGDVMYDAVRFAAQGADDIVDRLGLIGTRYAVATVHRAENTDSPDALARVLNYLREESRNLPIILVTHPRTVASAKAYGLDFRGLRAVAPLGYRAMAHLVAGSVQVYTDSGGLQKEAYFHRVPCVTMRQETEWMETIECGWNRMWTDQSWRPRRDISDYGTGKAAVSVAMRLQEMLDG